STSYAGSVGRGGGPQTPCSRQLAPRAQARGEVATACKNAMAAAGCSKSSANLMTSIHDDGPGSRAVELQSTLRRMQLACESLARRKDELELVLAASRTG